jgi:hypothetical protein
MGKFISIPFTGATKCSTTATCTVTSGVISAPTLASGGTSYQVAPYVTVTSTDGLGSGAVIAALVTATTGVITLSVVSGGAGYTSASTVVITVTDAPCYINADSVLSITPLQAAAGTAVTVNNSATMVLKLNTASTPTLTLVLAANDPGQVKSAITKTIMDTTNVKIVEQIVPVGLPSGTNGILSAVYS